ncbi:DUF3631 domain-containing protein [Bradyrhizobium sp. CCBAU 45389]|uniref:DUF3631 domain-containing protein n=1 Tax=Bradyrhizobium sp. CCBAU 45389 TaxID=858429 RepID=UPI0023065AFD|nr:DUF3631 domain-containing protein [Bradyrhizobium sp. CCBAU 45389]
MTKAPDINATLTAQGPDAVRARHDQAHRKQGALILDDVLRFLRRFVSYPSGHASVAHALWIAHTHLMSAWESTPRLAFLSPEPGSGKTRALEVTELLVPNPIATMNASPAYLFRKCGGDDGPPVVLFDEIDTVFGPRAKENEDVRAFLNSGHRRGATFGRCVVHGKSVTTEEIASYAAVALAGLGWLPDTITSRSIMIRMRRRAPEEVIEPFRRRVHATAGENLHRRLAAWACTIVDQAEEARPVMPATVQDRNADCWEALLAVGDLAGGVWSKLAREAAVALVAANRAAPPSLNLRLLSDLRTVFVTNLLAASQASPEGLSTKRILEVLHALEDAPWGDKGKPLDAYQLSVSLRDYDAGPKNLRPYESNQCKGYHLADLADVWRRYLSPMPAEAVAAVPVVTTEAFQRYFETAPTDAAVPSDGGSSQADGESRRVEETDGTAGTAATGFRRIGERAGSR